jgi:hypothetical protein
MRSACIGRAGAPAGGEHVDVRIGAVRRHRGGVAQHALGHVCVQVQARDDRQLRADDRAQALQQFAFGVVGGFGDRRAVQVEIDRVDRAGGAEIGGDLVADALERRRGDAVRRHRTGPHRGHERPALGGRDLHEAAER